MNEDFIKVLQKELSGIGNKITDNIDHVVQGVGGVIKNTSDALRGDLSSLGDTIGSEIGDVIGPEITGMTKSISGLGKNLVTSLIPERDDESKSDKERNSLLQSIVDYFVREEKRIARETPDKKKGLGYKVIMGLITAFGFLIGAIIRKITLPFELLYAALKGVIGIVKPIFKLISKLKIVRAVIDKLKIIFKPMLVILEKVGPIFTKLGGKILAIIGKSGLLTKLLGSVLRGFKFLGLPLTIFLGLIDFIKGFCSTEGTLVEKIKAGLHSAIIGFFSPIIMLFDWIGKKLGLGKIGTSIVTKVTDMFNSIKEPLEWMLNSFIGYWKNILGMIVDVFSSFIEGYIEGGIITAIKKSFGTFFDFLLSIPKKLIKWIKSIPFIGKKAVKEIKDPTKKIEPEKEPLTKKIEPERETPTKKIENIRDERVKNKREKEEEKERIQKEINDEMKMGVKEQKKAVESQTNIISQISNKQESGKLIEEIPTEIDNYVLGLAVLG